MNVKEKIKTLQAYRRGQWEQLVDKVYERRGWNRNGIPTLETVRRLGIDYPDVVGLLERNLKPEDAFQ
jgi:aldehyde:ferredoxin oxidoreductase